MAAARLIEPTSKARVPRILDNLGLDVSQRADLVPLPEPLCRAGLAREPLSGPVRACHHQRWSGPAPAGVTTLYFETEREDGLSRVGCSKEKEGHPGSSSACWSTVPASPSRSAAGRATRPRSPRSSRLRRPSRPPTASRSSPVVADPACSPPLIRRPWTRPPRPETGHWPGSRATSPTFPPISWTPPRSPSFAHRLLQAIRPIVRRDDCRAGPRPAEADREPADVVVLPVVAVARLSGRRSPRCSPCRYRSARRTWHGPLGQSSRSGGPHLRRAGA